MNDANNIVRVQSPDHGRRLCYNPNEIDKLTAENFSRVHHGKR